MSKRLNRLKVDIGSIQEIQAPHKAHWSPGLSV